MIDNDAPPPVRFTDHIKASLKRKLQVYLDRSVVWTKARWGGFAGLLVLYTIRVYLARGWYIVTYGLGIYVRIWLVALLPLARDLRPWSLFLIQNLLTIAPSAQLCL